MLIIIAPGRGGCRRGNPGKFETRNPKFEASSKFEIRKGTSLTGQGFSKNSKSEIDWFQIRVSNFEFLPPHQFSASTLLSTSSTSKKRIQRKSPRTRSLPR